LVRWEQESSEHDQHNQPAPMLHEVGEPVHTGLGLSV
jgi:hypothetical protein